MITTFILSWFLVVSEPVTVVAEFSGRYPSEENLIEVMFDSNLRVRLRSGRPVELGRRVLEAMDDLRQRCAGGIWYRLCDVPEEKLDELQARGERRTGRPVYNLNNIYRLEIPEGEDPWAMSRALEKNSAVIWARPVPLRPPPPLPPDMEADQGYLDPASSTPTGINAGYAWTQPGGDGTGVTVCDIEGGWNYDHHDLTKLPGSTVNAGWGCIFESDSVTHGTSVVGELVADRNGWGVTGICYGATLMTACDYYGDPAEWNPAAAIATAAASLQAGDIILLEEQWWLRPYTIPHMYVPIEWCGVSYPDTVQTDNPVYAAIAGAVAAGIHVIEPAGNGGVNLDNYTWLADSGAVIVGAGGVSSGSYTGDNLERISFSSYGSRVNVQGWGEEVVTTGGGDFYSAEGDDYYYTDTFSGTSSASPVVAGAAACCVGYWMGGLGQSKSGLSPALLRDVLAATGTPQVNPGTGNIGPRPDLLRAFRDLRNLVNPGGGIRSGDYDGDGTADIAVFRASAGLWSIRNVSRTYFGSSSDLPVPGDYDGDETTDMGIYRPSTGLWALRGVSRVYFGTSSDITLTGEYNGDGRCDIGVFRPSSGLWAIRRISRAYFGTTGDAVVPGDYNGDGTDDIAVFRSSSGLWAIRSLSRIYFGSVSAFAVPGDYNVAGRFTPGIFRPSSGLWAIRGVSRAYFGGSSDLAVPADYNGDGADEIGIFRDTAGLWAIPGVSRVYYGRSGDIPVTR
ncbi:MAG: S8 family serine peptidase [PVC group bacterium]